MTLKHRCLLMSGFATLSIVAILGSANAASQDQPTESNSRRANRCTTTTTIQLSHQ